MSPIPDDATAWVYEAEPWVPPVGRALLQLRGFELTGELRLRVASAVASLTGVGIGVGVDLPAKDAGFGELVELALMARDLEAITGAQVTAVRRHPGRAQLHPAERGMVERALAMYANAHESDGDPDEATLARDLASRVRDGAGG